MSSHHISPLRILLFVIIGDDFVLELGVLESLWEALTSILFDCTFFGYVGNRLTVAQLLVGTWGIAIVWQCFWWVIAAVFSGYLGSCYFDALSSMDAWGIVFL